MKKRNELLKRAFEEAAERELEALPVENKIIRPYSKVHEDKMKKLMTGKRRASRGRVRWTALIAAALMLTLLTLGAGAFIDTELPFIFKADPDNYSKLEVTFDEGQQETEGYDLVYTGGEITVDYSIDSGEAWQWPDSGIMVYFGGVRQSFRARLSDGTEYINTEVLMLENKPGQRDIELSFVPNTGRAGEEYIATVVHIYDLELDYYEQCDAQGKELFVGHEDFDHDNICDNCGLDVRRLRSGPVSYTVDTAAMARVLMKTDSQEQVKISKDYPTVCGKLYDIIYEGYGNEDGSNDYDTMNVLATRFYKDIKDSYFREFGAVCHSTRIITEGAGQEEYTINLHGNAGLYRVSLCVNNVPQQVFGGAEYADVNVVHGQQCELTVNLDTTQLNKGDNYVQVFAQRIDETGDTVYNRIDVNETYIIEVR